MSEPLQPEVHVHGTRIRREEPPEPEVPTMPNVRNWLIYGAVTATVAGLMLDGSLRHQPRDALLPPLSEATAVKSEVSQTADSLQVVVSWDLTLSVPAGRPDSIRVKVASEPPRHQLATTQSANQLADTTYLPAPSPGETAKGISCVAAVHPQRAPAESCTPWQYVRPIRPVAASAPIPNRIDVQPGGLQVDPDVGGRCAVWQRAHPDESVWTAVNRRAVPACTGPNGKPTVAQFCVFAVLPDGRRIRAAGAPTNSYCDELFVEWTRERYS